MAPASGWQLALIGMAAILVVLAFVKDCQPTDLPSLRPGAGPSVTATAAAYEATLAEAAASRKEAEEWKQAAGDARAALETQRTQNFVLAAQLQQLADQQHMTQPAVPAADAADTSLLSITHTGATDPWRRCEASRPFLGWDNATYTQARGIYAEFRALGTTRHAWDRVAGSSLFHLNPDPIPCASGLKGRLGPSPPHDGGKATCGFQYLPPKCVIYSLGGNLEWSFDVAATAGTPCDVWVFDCTVDPAAFNHPNPRIHPVHACIADSSFVIPAGQTAPQMHLHEKASFDRRFSTVPQLMAELGHDTVHYLKMDIEGSEYEVIAGMLRNVLAGSADPLWLPVQIGFEQHLVLNVGADRREVPPWRAMTPFLQLAELGYVVTNFEQNPICEQCAEWLVTRAWC